MVDTSAVLAILLDEPLADQCSNSLVENRDIIISAGTLAELLIVTSRRNLGTALTQLRRSYRLTVVAVDERLADLSLEAHNRYGKGVHPAKLNYGDCFSYALAKDLDCPLLFVGNDFSQTDITPAISSRHG